MGKVQKGVLKLLESRQPELANLHKPNLYLLLKGKFRKKSVDRKPRRLPKMTRQLAFKKNPTLHGQDGHIDLF
jgi:hypothetical protein